MHITYRFLYKRYISCVACSPWICIYLHGKFIVSINRPNRSWDDEVRIGQHEKRRKTRTFYENTRIQVKEKESECHYSSFKENTHVVSLTLQTVSFMMHGLCSVLWPICFLFLIFSAFLVFHTFLISPIIIPFSILRSEDGKWMGSMECREPVYSIITAQ